MNRLFLSGMAALALAACTAAPPSAPASGSDAASAPASAAEPAAAAAARSEAHTKKLSAGLAAAIANPARDPANTVRDVHRHPTEVLEFFEVKPGHTVIEFSPGGGYWTEILAPFLTKTGGRYIATGRKIEKLADEAKWGKQEYVAFAVDSPPLAASGTADVVLTFRNIHNFLWQPGMLDKSMSDSFAALKPGGVLGVVEHRADPRPETVRGGRSAADGYVSIATVVAAAEKAGFKLEAQSDVNFNPKDTKDHPFGVWTLPPNSRTSGGANTPTPADFNPEKYKAIGESDRMTLRFRKPA